jgi:acyl-CoA dehydrogenase
MAARGLQRKVRDAVRSGTLPSPGANGADAIDAAVERGVLTGEEGTRLRAATAARLDVIQVDAFDAETYRGLRR